MQKTLTTNATHTELKAMAIATIDEQTNRIVELSREIQRNPEVGFREHGTAQRLVEQLEHMGLDYRTGLARTGVKARMRADRIDSLWRSSANWIPSSHPITRLPTRIPVPHTRVAITSRSQP